MDFETQKNNERRIFERTDSSHTRLEDEYWQFVTTKLPSVFRKGGLSVAELEEAFRQADLNTPVKGMAD